MLRRAEAELQLGGGAGKNDDVADGESQSPDHCRCTACKFGEFDAGRLIFLWLIDLADDDLIDEGDIASDDD